MKAVEALRRRVKPFEGVYTQSHAFDGLENLAALDFETVEGVDDLRRRVTAVSVNALGFFNVFDFHG